MIWEPVTRVQGTWSVPNDHHWQQRGLSRSLDHLDMLEIVALSTTTRFAPRLHFLAIQIGLCCDQRLCLHLTHLQHWSFEQVEPPACTKMLLLHLLNERIDSRARERTPSELPAQQSSLAHMRHYPRPSFHNQQHTVEKRASKSYSTSRHSRYVALNGRSLCVSHEAQG